MIASPRYKVVGEMERYDERVAMQARVAIQGPEPLPPGSANYQEFYGIYPELETGDNKLRAIKNPDFNPLDHLFFFQVIMNVMMKQGSEAAVDGPPAPNKIDISPQRATEKVKGFARFLGADLVRVGPLNPAFVYSHIGKGNIGLDRKYGAPINLTHKHAISIAIGLDPLLMKMGPVLPMATGVMVVYNRLAMISTLLASYIRSLGYPARAHIVSNYQVACVPVAIDAGMGELGRHGIMLTRELGSSLKLTTVTTDLPLAYDSPVDIGVDEFCRDCRICAETCPSGAIPFGDKKVIRGVEKWGINNQACLKTFRETGTDCGICIAACPWTKPRTFFHRLAASTATKKKKAGWWMSRAEKLFYGRFRPGAMPDFFEESEPIWKRYKRFQ